MQKIMVLPGTVWQIPFIRKIKSMGHDVYICNPVKIDGVYQLTEHFLESDIFDYERIIDYCKNEKIDLVMSDECDIATDAVAYLNAAIGAKCLTKEMAELYTNKYRMREFCQEHNICPIAHKLCKTKDEAIAFFESVHTKLIMKPLDSNASHGVFTIDSIGDIEKFFDATMQFSRNAKVVLLEEYIDGVEFTVDGLMTSCGHKTLAISKKEHYKHNDNIACSLFFTQTSDQFDYDLLRATNDRLINETGLPFGLTHVEYKYHNGQFYLIEMAARGGGNLISAIIAPFMSGIDNYEYLIKSCLDNNCPANVAPDLDNDRTAVLQFLDLPCEGGIVREIKGEDYLRSDPRIKSFHLNFKVGDYIHQPENDSVRIGYYIICANSHAEYRKVEEKIKKEFQIILKEED